MNKICNLNGKIFDRIITLLEDMISNENHIWLEYGNVYDDRLIALDAGREHLKLEQIQELIEWKSEHLNCFAEIYKLLINIISSSKHNSVEKPFLRGILESFEQIIDQHLLAFEKLSSGQNTAIDIRGHLVDFLHLFKFLGDIK